jgi:CDP-diglyceride synthetase
MPGFKAFYHYWFLVCAFFMYIKTCQRYLLSALRGVPVEDVMGAARGAVAAVAAEAADGAGAAAAAAAAATGTGSASDAAAASARGLAGVLAYGADWVVSRYEPVAFGLYMLGFVAFVISLRQRRNFKYQFSQFAYCHMALLLVVVQSTYLAANIFNGLLWFFVPAGLVVCNDSFAYVAGFFFGRTPLIRLSPKKTVEGFVGGAVATVLFAFVSTRLYASVSAGDVKYLMCCPVVAGMGWDVHRCDVAQAAGGLYAQHPLSEWRAVSALLPASFTSSVTVSDMQWHAVVLAVFASVVAPFGGFFASGFKRAFKIKDFGDAIPGHGGFTDRMDCQLIMGAFSYIYCAYFLTLPMGPGGHDVVRHFFHFLLARLSEADLRALHARLGDYLEGLAQAAAAAAAAGGGGGGA